MPVGFDLDRGETVVRHVGGAAYDPATDTVNGSAFDRTAKDQDGLSVVRRGVFDVEESSDRQAIRDAVSDRRRLGATSVFAEIGVGAVLDELVDFDEPVRVVADPLPAAGSLPANPAHALILGLPFAGEGVGSLRSEEASDRLRRRITAIFPAVPR